MSTILKALRRLEQEKSSQSDRPLGEAVANTPPPAPRAAPTPWLIAAGSLVAAFAVTAAVLLLFRGDPEPAPEPVTIAQAPSPARSKALRSPAALPAPRVARAGAHVAADARDPRRRAVPSETAGATGLSRAALSSPDVEVVARPEPSPAEDEADAHEAVVLRRREPPRPGAGMARPLAPVEPQGPSEPPEAIEAPGSTETPDALEPLRAIARAEPAVEVAAPVSPLKPARAAVVADAPSAPLREPATARGVATPTAPAVAPPPAQAESPEPVIVAAAPTAPPKREPPASPPSSEARLTTNAVPGSAEPEVVAPRVVRREPTKRTNRPPALTAPARKSPPRPAAPEVKLPVNIAAVAPPVKSASPPRPAVKPAPAPERSVPAKPREILKTLPVPTESPSVQHAAVSDVYVERTIWHPLADRRVAIVSLGEGAEAVELREGDSLGPFVVGEIEPTGVYFQRGDEELRRRVGAR